MSTTRKALRRLGAGRVHFVDEAIPALGASDVLVRVRAVSLNYKDAAIADDRFPWPGLEGGIVGTEFAGEVVELGGEVASPEVGDRVVSLMNFDDITGREVHFRGFGQNIDGTLAEYVVVPAFVTVKIPQHLSWNEASMIPCSGVTAWSALMKAPLSGKTVLIQGTGGTSVIALTFAVKAGARVIITSSSDGKLQRAKEMGATDLINYKTIPAWEDEVLKVTGGVGVDYVIEQGGGATLLQSMKSLRKGGKVLQCGFLGDAKDASDLSQVVGALIMKAASIVGVRVGLKADLEDLMEYLAATKLSLAPCIDKVYDFEQAEEALDHLRKSKAFGKIVVQFK